MRLTVKAIDDQLKRLGDEAQLAKNSCYQGDNQTKPLLPRLNCKYASFTANCIGTVKLICIIPSIRPGAAPA